MSNFGEILAEIQGKREALDAMRPIEASRMGRIMQKFRLDWNYHSNHIEGNSLTYGETKSFLLHGITADGKPFRDHLDIKGHNEAILLLDEIIKEDRPLTETFIRELHRIILKEPYEKPTITPEGLPGKRTIQVGEYKTVPNHVKTVTGEMFYFTEPAAVPAEMGELLAWYREKLEEKDYSRVSLAALFHYKFIRIHPFDDGNGRVARILMNLILMQAGFPPVVIKTEKKNDYYAVLRKADGGDLDAFAVYVGEQLLHSLELMLRGASGESIEEEDDLDKEIRLWEKSLARHENRVVPRSNELLAKFILGNWNDLRNTVYLACDRFKAFFEYTEFLTYIGHSINTFRSEEEIIEQNPFRDYHNLYRIYLTFSIFNRAGTNVFNVVNDDLKIGAEIGRYTVKYRDFEKAFLYSQTIPESVMQEVADLVARDIFDEIKARTSEA